MAEISKITLPSGSTYDIKDATARELIAQIDGYTAYLGVTTTALTDGATTNPITINGESVTAKSGNIVNYGSKEFIFNGTNWNEFGDLSGLGDLAFKDSASASYTPAGSVSLSTTNRTATVSKASSGTATYTPEGSVSTPTITVTPSTTTVNSITAVGSMPTYTVASETLTITAGATPTKGENTTVVTGITSATSSQPTFTGTGARLVTGNIEVPNSAAFTGTAATITSD